MSKPGQDHDASYVNWVFDIKNRELHLGKNEDEDQKERDERRNKAREAE
jgi:hypothetical protein